MHLTGAQNT